MSENNYSLFIGFIYTIKGKRIAHSRSKFPEIPLTVEGHMPANHRITKKYWGTQNPRYYENGLFKLGPIQLLVEKMMEKKSILQQGFKSALES